MNRAAQLASRVPLPQGAIAIGVGLVVAGLTQYGFLAIASHALGAARYSPLGNFWALLFVCAPGFFLPLEQEVGRALSARRARGQGGRPLVTRAAAAGAGIAGALALLTLLLAGPLDAHLFGGDPAFVWALAAGFLVYAAQFIVRGTLAGNARFRPYGSLLALEGGLRVAFGIGLALMAVHAAGVYGLCLIGGSVVAVLAVAGRVPALLRPGPPASWSELSSALGYLLVASVMTQFLLSIGTIAVQLLATPAQHEAAGRFFNSRIVSYIPIFLFQAIQYALLPRLSALAARGHHVEFRRVLAELLGLVIALGAVSTAVLATLGPLATRLLFGGGFELGNLDFALLAGSCGIFMLAQVLSQALISLSGYARVMAGWLSGGVVFVVVTALGSNLFLRVELALVAGAVATVLVMAAMLLPLLRSRAGAHEAAELLAASTPVPET